MQRASGKMLLKQGSLAWDVYLARNMKTRIQAEESLLHDDATSTGGAKVASGSVTRSNPEDNFPPCVSAGLSE